ncbi:MAG TPA: CotH kinase family protein, partial [Saprospiraceae bacterium]|nr:CotH kinase family protein [Saprospiraceae bacterium]
MKFAILLLTLLSLLSSPSLLSQVRLTEIAPTNTGQITDEDGDHPDWIELQNQGLAPIDLNNWGLSDGGKSGRWLLPSKVLQPGERLLVFASGKNRGSATPTTGGVHHWETAVYDSDLWRWRPGTIAPPSDWNQPGFNASGWVSGPGGFGYGDGDDATQLLAGTISAYYRRTFTVPDKTQLVGAVLSMDYDDGFVAYLNGTEIARSDNLPDSPLNTTLAVPEHEAALYSGGKPDDFPLDAAVLDALLVTGDNVLAIEIHNTDPGSSDLTGRTWLHFGIASDQQFFGGVPVWFDPGGNNTDALHTDFKLNFSERIILYDAGGDIADSLTIGYLEPGHARMRLNDDGFWCTTAAPTPGAHNTGGCPDGYAAAPAFALPAGFYTGTQSVGINGGGEIRYTTDGSAPVETSPLYSGPVAVAVTSVLRARRFEPFKLPSQVITATYFINEPTTLSVVSICLPPEDFSEVYDNYSEKARVAVEFFDKNKQRQFAGDFAGYVVGNWSVSFPQKSLQFDVDEDFGSAGEIEYPIFPDKPIQHYHAFRIRNEDDDHNLARMRDRIVNELAAPTHAGRASYLNVTAFINGEYWGHYVARERLDNYFCRDNYGADPDSVNMVKTHFGQGDYVPEYGYIGDFYAMSDFIANNDMAIPANFQKANQLLDLENFTDYFITEIFVASTDWLQDFFNNIRLFKSDKNDRWKFILWDVSYSSGNASGCSGCDVLGSTLADQSRYGRMFNSLLDNPGYRRFFINRFADLMNTAFLTQRAHALIDTNAAELGPEIDRHHDRWGTGTFGHWSNAVDVLRDFYADRPAGQRQHIVSNFQLDKTVSITLEVNPPGAGVVKISTIVPQTFPWTGIYFHGNPVTLTAIPNPGFTFSDWSTNPFIGNT